jgi:hypothetical protein
MIEECKWSDKFVELQLWTRLASLSYQGKNHPLVVKCSKKALRFATVGTQPKNRKMDAYVMTIYLNISRFCRKMKSIYET